MALILTIDTALEKASVVLAEDEKIRAVEENTEQKNHATFVQPAIDKIFRSLNIRIQELSAVSVVYGPGSYTGLRVAMASAKGICYALNKPLMTINTLELMAYSVIQTQKNSAQFLYCPMIDARRMEVFTALYNATLQAVKAPYAAILSSDFLAEELAVNKILFFGNGSEKLKNLVTNTQAQLVDIGYTAEDLIKISLNNFQQQRFASLAYSEPFYLKDFYTVQKK